MNQVTFLVTDFMKKHSNFLPPDNYKTNFLFPAAFGTAHTFKRRGRRRKAKLTYVRSFFSRIQGKWFQPCSTRGTVEITEIHARFLIPRDWQWGWSIKPATEEKKKQQSTAGKHRPGIGYWERNLPSDWIVTAQAHLQLVFLSHFSLHVNTLVLLSSHLFWKSILPSAPGHLSSPCEGRLFLWKSSPS